MKARRAFVVESRNAHPHADRYFRHSRSGFPNDFPVFPHRPGGFGKLAHRKQNQLSAHELSGDGQHRDQAKAADHESLQQVALGFRFVHC